MATARRPFHAVSVGRVPGVYATRCDRMGARGAGRGRRDECKALVDGVPNARFKKFRTAEEARTFVESGRAAESGPTDGGHATKRQRIDNGPPPVSVKAERAESSTITVLPVSVKPERAESNVPPAHVKPENGTLVVYCDGAARNNGRPNARAGVGVFFGHGDPRNISERLPGALQTNQRAEIHAAIRALESVRGAQPVEIRTDSNYLVQAITSWSKKWRINGYRGVDGREIKNKDLFVRLNALVHSREAPVVWVHIAGHSGEPGNDAADRLAVEGSERATA